MSDDEMHEKPRKVTVPDIVEDFLASQRRVPEDGYSERASILSIRGYERYRRFLDEIA